MNLEKFIQTFETAVEAMEAGTLRADTNYKALPIWDSLAVLTVIDAIEMEYGVLLNRKDLEAAETVEELFEKKLEARS